MVVLHQPTANKLIRYGHLERALGKGQRLERFEPCGKFCCVDTFPNDLLDLFPDVIDVTLLLQKRPVTLESGRFHFAHSPAPMSILDVDVSPCAS